MFYSYCESLNFIFIIEGSDACGVHRYSMGSYTIGRRLNSLLDRRGVPIFANRLDLWVGSKSNGTQEWLVLEFAPLPAFASQERFEQLRPLHQAAHEAWKANAVLAASEEH
jgi:hypothetical protein